MERKGCITKGHDLAMLFVSPLEENAFEQLRHILDYTNSSGMEETSRAITRYIKGRESFKWDPRGVWHIIDTFYYEVLANNPRQGRCLATLKELIAWRANLCEADGTKMNLLCEDWINVEYKEKMRISQNLAEKIRASEDGQTKILLMGLAIMIQYEYFADLPEGIIKSLLRPATNAERGLAERKKEELMYVNEITRKKSDVGHIRNAFSHAHFFFVDDETVLLWDIEHGEINYFATLKFDDLKDIINTYNERIAIIQGYVYLLNISALILAAYELQEYLT